MRGWIKQKILLAAKNNWLSLGRVHDGHGERFMYVQCSRLLELTIIITITITHQCSFTNDGNVLHTQLRYSLATTIYNNYSIHHHSIVESSAPYATARSHSATPIALPAVEQNPVPATLPLGSDKGRANSAASPSMGIASQHH